MATLIVWAAFSLLATALQWLLQTIGLLTTMMQSASHYWSAALFLAAGLYQFSPLKERCLAYCRSPDGFILSEWRDGSLGAVVMGLRHGLFCLGCCAGSDGVAVRRRGHGSALGRGFDGAGDGREAPAETELLARCDWRRLAGRELSYVVLGGSKTVRDNAKGKMSGVSAEMVETVYGHPKARFGSDYKYGPVKKQLQPEGR